MLWIREYSDESRQTILTEVPIVILFDSRPVLIGVPRGEGGSGGEWEASKKELAWGLKK